MGEIDYKNLSKEEIQSAYASIDKENYPENYAALVAEMKRRKIGRKIGTWEMLGKTRIQYTPFNYIPLIALELWAMYGAYEGELYFPGRNGGYTFYGPSAKVAFLGISLFVSSGFYYMIKQDDILKKPYKKEIFWILFWGSIITAIWAILINPKAGFKMY